MAVSGTNLLKVPTICKVYVLGLCKGISPQKYGFNMVHYLKFPLIMWVKECHKQGHKQTMTWNGKHTTDKKMGDLDGLFIIM